MSIIEKVKGLFGGSRNKAEDADAKVATEEQADEAKDAEGKVKEKVASGQEKGEGDKSE
ncbi:MULTISPECIES: hypothetical protein [Thermocrispum]|jgi:hypothetical protein|uniref:CsbD family protein n=1 Tax=Thermocrispum agreste TaxID=37925 RepID=A0ABD6FH88_9PSEU|nr:MULTISPECIES: hypothetical protein [Thermocrispum]